MYLKELFKAFIEPEVVAGIIGGGIFTVILAYVTYVVKTKKYIGFYLKTKVLAFKKEYLRFSISYLYKIEINGKYLLIRGNRIPDQFQPVGGVFKYYSSAQNLFEEYGVLTDENIPIDENNNKDLRIRVKAKNAYKFIEWFNSRKNREISVLREFEEELIKTNLIPSNIRENFHPEYMKTHFSGVCYSEHFKCKEVFIAEIYNLQLTSILENEIQEYLNIIDNKNKNIILATREEIERQSFNLGGKLYTISKTSKWTI